MRTPRRPAALAPRLALLLLLIAPLPLAGSPARARVGHGVSPRLHDTFLGPGRAERFPVVVDLGEAPPAADPLDVLFLFDATASMGNVIDEVRGRAAEIMGDIRGMSTASRFAVAAFWDYGERQPFQLFQGLTADEGAVRSALGAIHLASGGDLPECYSRALHEAAFLDWRPDARRFVILFGDAPAHDPDFYGRDLGVDPGRDGVPGTADDLRLREVVKRLADEHISVLAVHDQGHLFGGKPLLREAIAGFQYMAEQTGGLTRPIREAREVRSAIRAGLRESYRPRPTLVAPPEFAGWVDFGEPQKLAGGARYRFAVALHPPRGSRAGVYPFPVRAVWQASPQGPEIGHCLVNVRMGWRHFRWRVVILPLYLLLLLLFLARRAIGSVLGRMPELYQWNHPALGMLGRLLVLAILIAGLVLLWHWDPNAPPRLD